MDFPACVVCFYEQNGVLPLSLVFNEYESALQIVIIRQLEVECVMLNGDVISRDQRFKNHEEYMKKLNTFQNKTARKIAYRVMGTYRHA